MTMPRRGKAHFPLLLGLAVVLSILGASSPAAAYAWMIRHGYNGCTPCHTDPSGGGLLTEYGRAMEAGVLRTKYTKAALEEEEPGPDAGFLWGAVKLPDELLMTVSYRSLYLGTKQPPDNSLKWRYIQMATDLRTQATFGRWRVNGSIGYVHEGARAAAITSSDKDNIVSREHWIGYDLDEDQTWLLRAGRMNLPFGIRSIEHTMFVRASTRTDINAAQQHGAALAYSGTSVRGEVMAIAGNYQIHPDEYRERGYSGYLEFSLDPHYALGVSSLTTYAKRDQELRISNIRGAHGVFARLSPWTPLVVLAEGDALVQIPPHGSQRIGYAGMMQADLEVIQGVHVMGTGELFDPGGKGSSASWAGWLSADWFFLPHAEFRIDAIRQKLSLGPTSVTANSYMGQFHLYL